MALVKLLFSRVSPLLLLLEVAATTTEAVDMLVLMGVVVANALELSPLLLLLAASNVLILWLEIGSIMSFVIGVSIVGVVVVVGLTVVVVCTLRALNASSWAR